MNDVNRLIGTKLRKLREACGLSQYEVAAKCHVKQSHICKTEKGAHALLFSEIFTYAKALDVKPDELFASICDCLNEYARSQSHGTHRPKAK